MSCKESEDTPLCVSDQFIEENKELYGTKSKKAGGPYNKSDRIKRRNEVYRLHFEYGYSAAKIAQLMQVNRNTINGDIDYWYSQVVKKWYRIDPVYSIVKQIESLEVQKSRAREELDKITNPHEKIVFERLIFDIDSKIMQIHIKLHESSAKVHELATTWLNNWMKKNKKAERYMTWFDVIKVSRKAQDRINKIIKDDR